MSRWPPAPVAVAVMPSADSGWHGWPWRKPIRAKAWRPHPLASAIQRCMRVSTEVGGTALLIHAKDEAAARWIALMARYRLMRSAFTRHPLRRVQPGSHCCGLAAAVIEASHKELETVGRQVATEPEEEFPLHPCGSSSERRWSRR